MIQGVTTGVSSLGRNNRKTSEDRYSVSPDGTFMGVYDGHGGAEVSEYVSKHMPGRFKVCHEVEHFPVEEAFVRAFEKVDADMKETDAVMHRMAGTTVTCAHVRDEMLYVANVGDSRAILVKSDGTVQVLTVEDNCRTNVEEVNRIRLAGGKVVEDRVDRILAVTRAIGDGDFRSSGVITVPHVSGPTKLSPGDVVILATDGLWDVLSNDQVSQIVRRHSTETAQCLSQVLVSAATLKRTPDDITVIVLVKR